MMALASWARSGRRRAPASIAPASETVAVQALTKLIVQLASHLSTLIVANFDQTTG